MFNFTFVTPEKKMVHEAEAEEVSVPAFRGMLTIYPGHAPLVTTLNVGIIKYRLKGETTPRSAVVSWGYMEVTAQGVIVLAETAESLEDLDRERAEEALRRAQKRLTDPSLEGDQIQKYQRKVKRALARIELSKLQ